MQSRSTRRLFLKTAGCAVALSAIPDGDSIAMNGQSTSTQDPAYQSGRNSLCQITQPPGKPLAARKSDTGSQIIGSRAERVMTYIADASKLKGGNLELCSEYGRVEVMDSDDEQVRLQIRCTAAGEGAVKAIEDTDVRAHLTDDNG